MTIARYVKGVQHLIAPYLKRSALLQTTQRCCIYLRGRDIFLVQVNKSGTQTELLASYSTHYDNIENLQLVLTNLNDKYQLANTPLYWLLSPDDYQLFVTDNLPVPEAEFMDALRWRVKSLISYPIEEAMIDYFMLPAKKGSRGPMMVVITSKTSFVNKIIEITKASELKITDITIPELALRNLAALYETDEKSTAVLYFYENGAVFNITNKKTLYFTRRLTLGFTTATQLNYEQIALDLLRYFDYFQSQWRMPMPSRMLVASEKYNVNEMIHVLSQNLQINVQPFEINTEAKGTQPFIKVNTEFLLPYGCTLFEDTGNAAPTS